MGINFFMVIIEDMKDIAIYGVGGFGREIACLIRRLNEKELKWRFVGFFDDNPRNNLFKEYGILLGGCNELNFWETSLNIVIAIGKSICKIGIFNFIIVDFPWLIKVIIQLEKEILF